MARKLTIGDLRDFIVINEVPDSTFIVLDGTEWDLFAKEISLSETRKSGTVLVLGIHDGEEVKR